MKVTKRFPVQSVAGELRAIFRQVQPPEPPCCGTLGSGEPLSVLLRKGNAGSNTAADHITVVRAALKQLPSHRPGRQPGRQVLVRADAGGCTHTFMDWLVGQRLQYSIGFALPTDFGDALERIRGGTSPSCSRRPPAR